MRSEEAGEDLGWEDFGWEGLGPGMGVPKKAARVACLALGMVVSAAGKLARKGPTERGYLRLGRLLCHGG